MFLDTPDGRIDVIVKAVRKDGSFDWVSECGNFSGLGSKLKLQDENGNAVKPVAQISEMEALQAELALLKSQITEQAAKIASVEQKINPGILEPSKEESK